jgi:hypothetical protein
MAHRSCSCAHPYPYFNLKSDTYLCADCDQVVWDPVNDVEVELPVVSLYPEIHHGITDIAR